MNEGQQDARTPAQEREELVGKLDTLYSKASQDRQYGTALSALQLKAQLLGLT